MRRLSLTALMLSALGSASMADTLTPPEPAEAVSLTPATSSLDSTQILINVLTLLLVWAAVQQNNRIN